MRILSLTFFGGTNARRKPFLYSQESSAGRFFSIGFLSLYAGITTYDEIDTGETLIMMNQQGYLVD